MKILGAILCACALILFRAALSANASDVQLAWDASPSTVTNYVVWATNNAVIYRANFGTNLTGIVEGLKPGRWSFAVTAVNSDGVSSDPSEPLNAEVPRPPANLRTVIVEHSISITNFSDVGFFRLRIP